MHVMWGTVPISLTALCNIWCVDWDPELVCSQMVSTVPIATFCIFSSILPGRKHGTSIPLLQSDITAACFQIQYTVLLVSMWEFFRESWFNRHTCCTFWNDWWHASVVASHWKECYSKPHHGILCIFTCVGIIFKLYPYWKMPKFT